MANHHLPKALRIDVSVLNNPIINEENTALCPLETHSDGRPVVHMSRRKAMKNLLVMSLAYLMFFLGFWALSNLESTINASGGLGTESQAVIYAVSMFSSLFLPELVVKSIGCKRTLVYTLLVSSCYIAANMYNSPETMIPGSVLYGLASGPFNAAQSLYTEELAVRYAMESEGETLEHVMARFFGIFMMFSESTQILGNIASYFVLNMGSVVVNTSTNDCGMDFHASNSSNPNLDPPSDQKRYILIGIYLLGGVLSAVVMFFFADPLENDIEKMSPQKRCSSTWDRIWAAVKLLRNPKQYLMIPLTIFIGMEGAVYAADFTEAYIACSWGISHVGFVSICFGVCGALMGLSVGPLVKYTSQMFVILSASSLHAAICITLYLWRPTSDQVLVYFVIAGAWGMCDAIWWSQIPALYGLMFPNDREACFSNCFFWSSLGFLLCYSYANYFTIVVKISIMLSFLIAGTIGYLLCQFIIWRNRDKSLRQ